MMFSALTSKLFGGLAAVLAIALLFTIISKNGEIRSLTQSIEAPRTGWRARLDACNAARLTLKANQGTLEASIARQNSSLEAMRAQAATRLAQASEQRRSASEAAQAAQRQAAALAARRSTGNVCEDANRLILENM